jgi:hypothetical protein
MCFHKFNPLSAYTGLAGNASARTTGHRPVIGVNDGFKKAHKIYLICLAGWGGGK